MTEQRLQEIDEGNVPEQRAIDECVTEIRRLRVEVDLAQAEARNAYNTFPPLLHGIDHALNGPDPDELTRRSYAPLPERARAVMAENALLRAEVAQAQQERAELLMAVDAAIAERDAAIANQNKWQAETARWAESSHTHETACTAVKELLADTQASLREHMAGWKQALAERDAALAELAHQWLRKDT